MRSSSCPYLSLHSLTLALLAFIALFACVICAPIATLPLSLHPHRSANSTPLRSGHFLTPYLSRRSLATVGDFDQRWAIWHWTMPPRQCTACELKRRCSSKSNRSRAQAARSSCTATSNGSSFSLILSCTSLSVVSNCPISMLSDFLSGLCIGFTTPSTPLLRLFLFHDLA